MLRFASLDADAVDVLAVHNNGKSAVELSLQTTAPHLLWAEPRAVVLEPGQTTEFRCSLNLAKGADLDPAWPPKLRLQGVTREPPHLSFRRAVPVMIGGTPASSDSAIPEDGPRCVLVDERCDTSNGGEAAPRQASQIRERSRRWIRVGQRGQAQLAYYESLGLFDHALEDVPDGLAGDSALYQLWRAPVAERLADGGVVTLLSVAAAPGRAASVLEGDAARGGRGIGRFLLADIFEPGCVESPDVTVSVLEVLDGSSRDLLAVATNKSGPSLHPLRLQVAEAAAERARGAVHAFDGAMALRLRSPDEWERLVGVVSARRRRQAAVPPPPRARAYHGDAGVVWLVNARRGPVVTTAYIVELPILDDLVFLESMANTFCRTPHALAPAGSREVRRAAARLPPSVSRVTRPMTRARLRNQLARCELREVAEGVSAHATGRATCPTTLLATLLREALKPTSDVSALIHANEARSEPDPVALAFAALLGAYFPLGFPLGFVGARPKEAAQHKGRPVGRTAPARHTARPRRAWVPAR